ncbi:hypothetical protein BDV36DRAFT_279551 [Aspergillus pseudocaelatus]|uniref:Nucleoside phosphorylase domain-containing protein n=1 Tax=Aspergillus pseudocaelatus TaxID=1825620 RepID=A0ABQ6X162_9EURO|nr:hypothetical protein BDV36DRAFT_279551 [Aspergillus pseudocaelatus]
MPSIGKGAASSVASNVRNSFKKIELALVVGICGAAPWTPSHEEILLGDVVISDGIIQYDLGRRLPHSFIRKDTLLDNLGRPSPRIRGHLAKLRGRRSQVQLQEELILHLTELQERWPDQSLESPGIEQDQLFQSTYHHQHHQIPCSVCSVNVIEDYKDHSICQEALHMTCDELVCDPKMTIPRIRHQVALDGKGPSRPAVIRSGVDRDILVERDGVIAFEIHKNKHWQNYAAVTAAA